MREYKPKLQDADAPTVIVPSYSVETYFALGEEQAEKEHVKRCIQPELPNNHGVYSAMHSLPESLYESKERDWGSTIWKIRKAFADDVVKRLGLEKTDYPYKEALNLIDDDFF